MAAIRNLLLMPALAASVLVPGAASAADEQFFASIFLKKDKIGQVHIRLSRDENGEVEELRARASVSLLGINLYEFTQDQKQVWESGELQSLSGRTDNNGTILELELQHNPQNYTGTINKKPVTLPANAYPDSIWQYGIVDHNLLFSQLNLTLLDVEIDHRREELAVHGKTVPTERVDIRGDFTATVWFDDQQQFVKAEYVIDKRKIEAIRDP